MENSPSQFTIKQLLLVVACFAVALAIFAQSIHSGEFDGMRDPKWLSFAKAYPPFWIAIGAAVGAMVGRFWIALAVGLAVQVFLWGGKFFLVAF